MKRRTLQLALILALVSLAHALIGARLHAQTKFGITAGGASGGGSGTVTSVAATVPGEITLTGSPITGAGTLAFSWANQLTSKVFAAPCGSTGTPTFRVLCAADIPALDPSKITGTAVITSDSRLSDARTPTAHASTHASVGSDSVTLAESQVTGLTAALAGKQATGNYITSVTGDVVASGPGAAAATIQANSVALGTDTTGNYAGSSTEGGSATTADALAANGTNCSAPNFGRGVDAAGNCEGAAIVASDLPNTAVTPGSYTATNLTVDAQGRITAASNGTAGGDTLPIVDTTAVVKGSSDATKLLRFEVDGFTTGQTRVATPPDANFTIARTDAAQTFTGPQTYSGQLLAGDGSAASPSYAFGSGFGIYKASGSVAWSASSGNLSGLLGAASSTAGYAAIGNGFYYLGSSIATTDAGIGRVAASVTGAISSSGSVSPLGTFRALYNETGVGANVASATTITLTGGIQHVTGTSIITTINLPRAGFTGCVQLIPDAVWLLATGGNVAIAATAVVSRAMTVCYDGSAWYPSYL